MLGASGGSMAFACHYCVTEWGKFEIATTSELEVRIAT